MPISRRKFGPGGTEFLKRPNPWGGKGPPRTELDVAVQPDHGPSRHRQTLEQASQALAAMENAQSEGLRAKVEMARGHRLQFWMDTCREVPEMRNVSPQMLELHRQHGCRFCVPTLHQVQHIIDALDSALPGWDRDHPELFYKTLELNFPELVRACRAQRRV